MTVRGPTEAELIDKMADEAHELGASRVQVKSIRRADDLAEAQELFEKVIVDLEGGAIQRFGAGFSADLRRLFPSFMDTQNQDTANQVQQTSSFAPTTGTTQPPQTPTTTLQTTGTTQPAGGAAGGLTEDPVGLGAFYPEAPEGPIGGFPEDYRTTVPLTGAYIDPGMRQLLTPAMRRRGAVDLAPRYNEFDAARRFADADPAVIADYQDRMVEAGLLDPDDIIRGHWDRLETDAMSGVMYTSNLTGMRLDAVLDLYAANYDPEDKMRKWRREHPFVAKPYRAPDYASLAQAVKETFRSQLGRDPKDYELALLSDEMRAEFNRANAADISAARAEYEATARAFAEGEPQGSGTVSQVDPTARFREAFEKRYAAEREHVETVQEGVVDVRNIMNTLALGSAMSGPAVNPRPLELAGG